MLGKRAGRGGVETGMLTHMILIFVRSPVAIAIAAAVFTASALLGAWSAWS